MKILTGKLRGQEIPFKPNPHLRPTPDKVRQAIFNMLQGALEDKNVLDLFSGTGALGLEALSNGAAKVTFVEKDARQCERIQTVLDGLKCSDRGEVEHQDALDAVRHFSVRNIFFDIIFMDPPYDALAGIEALRALAVSNCLHEDTLIFFECRNVGARHAVPLHKNPVANIGPLHLLRKKNYGDTQMLVYRMRDVG